jgi:AcrR family transcriptional regulator
MLDYSQHPNAEQILRNGWELFQQKGYLGVSIDDICHSSGITKPTLYYYFKNKENLFVEVLLFKLRGFHAGFEPDGSLSEKLERISLMMFDSFKMDYSYLVRDLTNIQSAESVARVYAAFSDELAAPMVKLMQSAAERGEIRGDARFNAHLFMGMVESYIARSGEFDLDNPALAKRLADFFIKGAR